MFGSLVRKTVGWRRYWSRSRWSGFFRLEPWILGRFLRLYEEVMPRATAAGRRLHRSGALRAMSHEQIPVSEVLARVSEEIASAT
jgi:hypothetical protein